MSENDSDMIYGLWDKPSAFELILLSLQRLCAIFGATLLVPIVVNTTVGEPVFCSSCIDCFWCRYTPLCNLYKK